MIAKRIRRRNYKSRRTAASARKLNRDGLSPEQQLKKLDERLGYGQGAFRERNRLLAQCQQSTVESV